jgi:hypothetical protein
VRSVETNLGVAGAKFDPGLVSAMECGERFDGSSGRRSGLVTSPSPGSLSVE